MRKAVAAAAFYIRRAQTVAYADDVDARCCSALFGCSQVGGLGGSDVRIDPRQRPAAAVR